MEEEPDAFDFLEIVPDTMWEDLGPSARPRYADEEAAVRFLREVRAAMPVIPHGVGLSIGSAHRFDTEHVEKLAQWQRWLDFPWHSDHLAYSQVAHGAGEINVGFTMPLALDREALDLVVEHAGAVLARVPAPFLLENNVYYFRLTEAELEETEFLNQLARRSGCGLLLDLHNLYTNARNHGYDADAFLDRLDLDRVIEIHVAGGMEHAGFYLDAHSDVPPGEVWRLLERVLPECANLGGVVFELFKDWVPDVGRDGLRRVLGHVREAWTRHHPDPGSER